MLVSVIVLLNNSSVHHMLMLSAWSGKQSMLTSVIHSLIHSFIHSFIHIGLIEKKLPERNLTSEYNIKQASRLIVDIVQYSAIMY